MALGESVTRDWSLKLERKLYGSIIKAELERLNVGSPYQNVYRITNTCKSGELECQSCFVH